MDERIQRLVAEVREGERYARATGRDDGRLADLAIQFADLLEQTEPCTDSRCSVQSHPVRHG